MQDIETQLTPEEILSLKPGDLIRIGNVVTECWHWHPAKNSFYTKDWFTDAQGVSTTCYGVDTLALQYDIGRVPVYRVL